MTIDVTGDIDDVSGTFEMYATMNTGDSTSKHEVKQDGVLTLRDNTTTYGSSSSYTIEIDLSGDDFDFTFDGEGGNSMSGSTVQTLDTQSSTAHRSSPSHWVHCR